MPVLVKCLLSNFVFTINKQYIAYFKAKNMDLLQLGVVIKQRRQRLRIRQNDLADLAGVGLRTVIAIETGVANPSFETLSKIGDVLGLELTLTIKS